MILVIFMTISAIIVSSSMWQYALLTREDRLHLVEAFDESTA